MNSNLCCNGVCEYLANVCRDMLELYRAHRAAPLLKKYERHTIYYSFVLRSLPSYPYLECIEVWSLQLSTMRQYQDMIPLLCGSDFTPAKMYQIPQPARSK